MSLDYEDEGRSMSGETRAAVEEEVKALVQAAYERARKLLVTRQAELHALAGELLERETLSGDDIKARGRAQSQDFMPTLFCNTCVFVSCVVLEVRPAPPPPHTHPRACVGAGGWYGCVRVGTSLHATHNTHM